MGGNGGLSSVVTTQLEIHARFGGDRAQTGGVETVHDEQLFGCGEDARFGGSAALVECGFAELALRFFEVGQFGGGEYIVRPWRDSGRCNLQVPHSFRLCFT